MQKISEIGKKVTILAISNLLWGFIPWPASKLNNSYSSFIIVFIRFVLMGLFLFLITLIMLIIEKQKRKKDISFKILVNYLRSRNHGFYNIPQWFYLILISLFGLNFLTIFFFLGLKFLGSVITSIGIIFSLIAVTLINWGKGKEDISKFKVIYLVILIVATIILGMVGKNSNNSMDNFPLFDSILILLIYGSSLTFFTISGSMDKISPKEYEIIIKNPKYKLIRTFFKLGILSLTSAILIPLLLGIFQLIPMNEVIQNEIDLFFNQITQVWTILEEGYIYFLILGCTLFPYLIFYYLSISWPKFSSFELWASVLQLLEPIMNIILGITLLNENFSISWVLIIIFLLIIGILLKYIGETENQIQGIIFIRIKPQKIKKARQKLFQNRYVRELSSLIGEYDIMVFTQFFSSKALNSFLLEIIQKLPGLIDYNMQIISEIAKDKSP